MKRRQFIARLAAAGLLSGAAGCAFDGSEPTTGGRPTAPPHETPDPPTPDGETTTASPTPTPEPTARSTLQRRYGDRFDSIVDVTEAGADDEGEEPIDDVLADAVADDTLVYFPSGTYSLRFSELEGFENVGLVSDPGERATIVPATDAAETDNFFVRFLRVSDLLLEGFRFDYTASGRGGLVQVLANGDFTVRDVRVDGPLPGESNAFMFEAVDEGATGRIERLVAPDGGHENGDTVGIYVGRQHAGELHFEDCHLESFPNNGLYASTPASSGGGGGSVHVRSGTYKNNNISNVRIGGDGSTVEDATIVMDETPPKHPNGLNVRGIRLRRGRDHTVENCRIEIGENAGTGYGGIVLHADVGPTTVTDTQVVVDCDEMNAIRVSAVPGSGGDDASDGPLFRNVEVSGAAAGGASVNVNGRNHTEFRDCRVYQPGPGRDGFSFDSADGGLIAESSIAVTGSPIRLENADVETREIDIGPPHDGKIGIGQTTDGGGSGAARHFQSHSHD